MKKKKNLEKKICVEKKNWVNLFHFHFFIFFLFQIHIKPSQNQDHERSHSVRSPKGIQYYHSKKNLHSPIAEWWNASPEKSHSKSNPRFHYYFFIFFSSKRLELVCGLRSGHASLHGPAGRLWHCLSRHLQGEACISPIMCSCHSSSFPFLISFFPSILGMGGRATLSFTSPRTCLWASFPSLRFGHGMLSYSNIRV